MLLAEAFCQTASPTFQVLVKAGSDLSSACRSPYGSRRTEAFSFCRLTKHLVPQKGCVLSQTNIFIVALLIFIIIFQVYVQFHSEIMLSLG